MNAHPFFRLIELITFDQSIHELDRSADQITQDIATLKQKMGEQVALALQAQATALQARKTVDRIELDLQALDLQERGKRKKIDQVATYKESQALQRELDQIHANQQAFEDTLLQAWNSLEHAERVVRERTKQTAHVQQELQQALAQKEQEFARMQKERGALEELRESKTVGVPSEWLDKYNAMRSITTNPIVAVEGESCGACYHELSKQELTRLRRGALLECQGCFRFLYNKDILSESAPTITDNFAGNLSPSNLSDTISEERAAGASSKPSQGVKK